MVDKIAINDTVQTQEKNHCLICGESSNDFIEIVSRRCICMKCSKRIALRVRKQDVAEKEELLAMQKEHDREEFLDSINILRPADIYSKLSEYVVGQHDAKMVLSVAAYNHFKRMCLDDLSGVSKSNVMLIGDTGSGKTLLVNTLKDILNVPCVVTSATSLTENGYIGDDVEKLVQQLYTISGENIEKAQYGIIFIDEIDKLSEQGKSEGGKYVVGRAGVQQALLPLVEGKQVEVRAPFGSTKMLDTSNILFICGGAFDGITDIIARRMNSRQIGFFADKQDTVCDELLFNVTSDDLVQFGMIRELLGRFPSLAVLEKPSVEFLKTALTVPKNNLLWQYEKLLNYDGVSLQVCDDVIEYIAREAFEKKTGCRGLRAICDKIFLNIMFEAPDMVQKKVVVNMDLVRKCERKSDNYEIG